MRVNNYIAPFILSPILAFANTKGNPENVISSTPLVPKNTIINHYSSESNTRLPNLLLARKDYPTQIVRVGGKVEEFKITCEEVNKEIDKIFIQKINPDKFYYNTYIFCGFNPENHYAMNFSIHSYFDPLSNEAIDYLQKYLNQFNGHDLLGTKFYVENARGVVAALTINVGTKKYPKGPLILSRQDHSSFYFNSNYEMRRELISDIQARFYSNDPEQLLPFFDNWLFPHAGKFYHRILIDANYMEVQPETIFLMDDEPTLFVSNLKYYYSNDCTTNPNQHCL
ncbi:Lpg0189 family type II secretion system effector [Legionella sp. CNM-1927-20]|uniref:Lpg0189 family type II secretion system effector n=1 Tax=Legionella sp. CNM-1927-20 TaxID=3422221 RepID=UPI00403B302C